jgi:hypothetical protein
VSIVKMVRCDKCRKTEEAGAPRMHGVNDEDRILTVTMKGGASKDLCFECREAEIELLQSSAFYDVLCPVINNVSPGL